VAGLSRDTSSFSQWWGVADVSIAFVLAMLALVMVARAEGRVSAASREATYRAYRVLLHGIIVLLAVFFVAGERVTWINCLTGFAWRGWLLLYALPAWFTLLRTGREAHAGPASFRVD
jgi:hypothetical protein